MHLNETIFGKNYLVAKTEYVEGKSRLKNIKPAHDPFYTLDKYYGNLTIQEYRQLLGNSHILLIVDKPLTKILPELHEENFDLRPNYKSIHNNTPNSNLNKLSLRRKHPVDSKKIF